MSTARSPYCAGCSPRPPSVWPRFRRCYVLAGGASKPLLLAIQHAACGWGPEDYSAAGFAELAWALAACGQPLTEPCRQLLRSALGGATGGAGSEHAQAEEQRHAEQQAAAEGDRQTATALECSTPPQQEQEQQQPQPQQQDHQQQRPQQPRDWAAWFKGTPASRVVLLLWAAAQLDCRPCSACLAAAVATLARDAGLAKLPTKVRWACEVASRHKRTCCLTLPCRTGKSHCLW